MGGFGGSTLSLSIIHYVTFWLQEKRKQAVRTGRYVDLTEMTDEALDTVQHSVEAHHRVKQESINAIRYAAANAIETEERKEEMVHSIVHSFAAAYSVDHLIIARLH